MRQGEVLGLQWADFDFAGHFVEVRQTVGYRGGKLLVGSPKSGKARRVDLPTPLAAALQRRKSLLEAEAAIGKPVDALNLVHRVWLPLLEKAGLCRIRFGESLAYVKDQLGHHSIQVTVDLYVHLVPGANRNAVDRLAAATNCNLYATGEQAQKEEREATSDEGWSRRWDLNPRPADYESAALPLSYTGLSRTYERRRVRFYLMC